MGAIVLHSRSRRPSEPGARTKQTPEREEAILNALALGLTKQAACGRAGISISTLANWLDGDDEFAEAVEIAQSQGEATLLGLIISAAEIPRNWTAAAWVLERTKQGRYALRTKAAQDETVSSLPMAIAEEVRKKLQEMRSSPAPLSDSSPDVVEGVLVES